MKDNIILLSVNPYRVVDEATKNANEGLSIMYIMGNNLAPQSDKDSGFLGHRVLKGSVPKDNLLQCREIPAVMECDFEVKPDSSGKASLKPRELKYISPLMPPVKA